MEKIETMKVKFVGNENITASINVKDFDSKKHIKIDTVTKKTEKKKSKVKKEQPVEEQPVEEQPVEEQPVEEQPVDVVKETLDLNEAIKRATKKAKESFEKK